MKKRGIIMFECMLSIEEFYSSTDTSFDRNCKSCGILSRL